MLNNMQILIITTTLATMLTAITLLYVNFDNNYAMRGTRTIHSKPILLYQTRGGTLKNA